MSRPDFVNRYNVGDLARLAATVAASGAAPANPSMMTMVLVWPSGSASYVFGAAGASIANPSPGIFYKDVTITMAGTWNYGYQATGLIQAAEEWVMLCDHSRVFNL